MESVVIFEEYLGNVQNGKLKFLHLQTYNKRAKDLQTYKKSLLKLTTKTTLPKKLKSLENRFYYVQNTERNKRTGRGESTNSLRNRKAKIEAFAFQNTNQTTLHELNNTSGKHSFLTEC